MQHQKNLFDLPQDITYLNCAYMSPQLKSVTEIGTQSVLRKARPNEILPEHFFDQRTLLKQRFASLIDAPDYRSTAIIPSVSYGIANAAKNTPLKKGDEIILVDEQFPSNFYVWQDVAKDHGAIIRTITPPAESNQRGRQWNEAILSAITPKTAVVAMANVHWADGTLFDLKAIREKTKAVHALLVIDGTQSIGALPFSIQEVDVDALVCGGYKWMLGPYAIGMAYYGEAYHQGTPIEHNWMNRHNSEDFNNLTQYEDRYQVKAARFSVGESSNFVLTPMLINAIDQLLKWTPENIQNYTKQISKKAITRLQELGCYIENETHRGNHLFGIYLPSHINIDKVKTKLKQENIIVSYRGNAIRVSPHLYNTEDDFNRFASLFA